MQSKDLIAGPPLQVVPVARGMFADRGQRAGEASGVVAAQNSCEGLTGLAQQMCYATLYGI